jgi:Transcriptional regulator
MTKIDRRIQRTRELLRNSLIELISERGYDTVTIGEIVERANVGRTTFYLHFNSKDELFLSCHEAIVSKFHLGLFHPLSRAELLSLEMPPEMTLAYQHLEEDRALLHPIFQGKDSALILRQIRDRSAREIAANLRVVFADVDSAIPLDLLANYLAGAQIAFMQWWLEKRRPYRADDLAQTLYRLQRAAIRDAFGLREGG